MTEDDEVDIHFLPPFLPLPTHCQFLELGTRNRSASIIPYCTYQRCRIELRDDMMDEDGEVSWSGLEQADALEGATLSVNLTEEERTGARREDRYHAWEDQKFFGKAFFFRQTRLTLFLI